MKKLIACSLIVFSALTGSAQRATLADGVVTYMEKTYKVGDTLHLAYGSNSNKDFAFAYMGSGLAGVTALNKGWSKSSFVVDKVYKAAGKLYARGKVLDAGAMMGNKVFVDIEGAVDNKELKID